MRLPLILLGGIVFSFVLYQFYKTWKTAGITSSEIRHYLGLITIIVSVLTSLILPAFVGRDAVSNVANSLAITGIALLLTSR